MSHFRNTSNFILNFRKNNTQALVIWERMYFYRSESTMDSLKSVFNVFRRKPSLGACKLGTSVVHRSLMIEFLLVLRKLWLLLFKLT